MKILICSLLLALAPTTTTSVVTVVNATNNYLGWTVLSDGINSVGENVGANASVGFNVSFTPARISIAAQNIVYPNNGPITLSNGAKIGIWWTSPSLVEIYDWQETASPNRQDLN